MPELFEKVSAPIDFPSNQFDLICIRSLFNENFLTVDESDKDSILKASVTDINKASQFMVYYGEGKKIGLKLASSGEFVKTKIINKDRIVTAGSDDSSFLIFEHEYFEAPVDYPIYEVESTSRVDVQMTPIERLKFPKTFTLKSQATGYNIRVDESKASLVYAQSKADDNWETFQVLYFPNFTRDRAQSEVPPMHICLRSLGNDK